MSNASHGQELTADPSPQAPELISAGRNGGEHSSHVGNDTEQRYYDIMNAIQLLREARKVLSAEDGPNVSSPAWALVVHAQRYLTAQANAVLRGDKTFCHRGNVVLLMCRTEDDSEGPPSL